MAKEKNETQAGREAVFSKEQILQASRFSEYVDIIDALLEADRQYTITQVEDIVSKFLKGKVK